MKYQVYVGNIGLVYDGSDYENANSTFNEYKDQSEKDYGRAAGESVTLLGHGNIEREFIGKLDKIESAFH